MFESATVADKTSLTNDQLRLILPQIPQLMAMMLVLNKARFLHNPVIEAINQHSSPTGTAVNLFVDVIHQLNEAKHRRHLSPKKRQELGAEIKKLTSGALSLSYLGNASSRQNGYGSL